MDRDSLIAVLLGILLLVSAVQSYELMLLKGKLASAQAGAARTAISNDAAVSPPSSGGQPNAAVSKSLQNLPTQVGGC